MEGGRRNRPIDPPNERGGEEGEGPTYSGGSTYGQTPGTATPGFGGQTPLTAASFGSRQSSGGAGEQGGYRPAAAGGLQPTPIVPRAGPAQGGAGGGGGPYPTPVHQPPRPTLGTTAARPSAEPSRRPSTKRRKLEAVPEEAEDPSMLRYESRPGMDRSPMASDPGGDGPGTKRGRAESEASGAVGPTGPPAPLHRDPTAGGAGPAPLAQHGAQGPPPVLREFPFVFDGYAAWVCRHCQHVPPYYRGTNYVWQAPDPPPNRFVDLHLGFCPGLNPQNLPPPAREQPRAAAGMPQPLGTVQSQEGGYPMQSAMMQPQQGQWQMQESPSQHQHASAPGAAAPDPPGQGEGGDKGGGGGQQPHGGPRGAPGAMSWHSYQGGVGAGSGPYGGGGPHQYGGAYPFGQGMMGPGGAGPAAHAAHYPQQLQPHGATSPPKPKRKSSGTKVSPKGRHTDDATYRAAIDFLTTKSAELAPPADPSGSDTGRTLVERADADLLTDYLYHMMRQLVVCRFSERDRKTRGGKREGIALGYGGLQCLHCLERPSARKFFWSSVDRLSNSFAEIPGHVLKCRHCPADVRDALLALKGRHPDQMQMLPRGSQKVFFRRMWRRLHDGDAGAAGAGAAVAATLERPGTAAAEDPPPAVTLKSPDLASNAAANLLRRSSVDPEARRDGSPSEERVGDTGEPKQGQSPSETSRRVLLAIPEDKDWLSDTDCFVRSNVEVFGARQDDVDQAAADRKYPILVGQVGIRCIHCAAVPGGARGAAVSYPYSVSGIYESVREFQRLHLDSCPNVSQELRAASEKLAKKSASLSSVLRRYYVQAARALGLHDTHDGGIRAGGTPVPMSTAGFQTPASRFRPTEAGIASREPPGSVADRDRDPPDEDRKPEASQLVKKQEAGQKLPRDIPAKEEQGYLEDKPDAPGMHDVPGTQDAPGERAEAITRKENEDAPGEGAGDTAAV
ncbi:hypothetical protein ACHAWF_017615 [Thalassiosira exigua]